MPVEPIDGGEGGVVYPYGVRNVGAQTVGMNPNASWAVRAISQYNRPSITQVDYADLDRATEYNRLLIEERMPGRFAPDPTAQLGINISKGIEALSSDIAQGLTAAGQGISNLASSAISRFQETSNTPANWRVWNPQVESTNLNSLDTYYSAPEKLGFIKQQTLDGSGRAIGWSYVPMMDVSTPSVSVSTPDAATQLDQNVNALADQALARSQGAAGPVAISDADYYMGARNYMGRRWSNDWTIYEKAAYYRDNLEQNKRATAIELYGQPVQTTRPDGSVIENWVTSGNNYYGLLPGEVPTVIVNPPSKDAPYEDWVKYVNRMEQAIRVPLYKTGTANTEIDSMAVPDYKEFQRRLIAAGAYPPGTPVASGVKTEFEDRQMESLMAIANRNGMTWQQVLDIRIKARTEALAAGGINGGGGDGSGSGSTSTYTQTQYSQTSISTARSLLSSVLTSALGRMPTDEEVKNFVEMLNEAESKSPTTTVTNTIAGDGTTSSTSRTTPSTVDERQMAMDFAKQIGGGSEFTANSADNYIAGLMQYLGG